MKDGAFLQEHASGWMIFWQGRCKTSLTINETSESEEITVDLFDRLILDQPHSLSALPKIQSPDLGADDYLLTGAFVRPVT